MHVLVPFDIVPASKRVPYGVAPVSKRAIQYAIDVFGPHDDARLTAVHLTEDATDLPANVGTSEIESMVEGADVAVETEVRTLENADSMPAIRERIVDLVDELDADTVVVGYEERSFVDEVFQERTPSRVLESQDVPVVLVP